MDEFKDLDAELERLRQELATSEYGTQLRSPGMENYWKNRVNEERILWKKKMETSEEEKKALAAKLQQQEEHLKQYQANLGELEKKFESNARLWEEKLRIKEADILVEKNRLMCEEKIKEAEIENHQYLAQVAELNAKINTLKDDHLAEIDRINGHHEKEKEALAEKCAAQLKETELLQEKAAELEDRARKASADHARAAADFEERIAALDREGVRLAREKDRLAADNTALARHSEEERERLRKTLTEQSTSFARAIESDIGQAIGLADFIARNRVTPDTIVLLKELLEKTDNDSARHLQQLSAPEAVPAGRQIALCLSDGNRQLWEAALAPMQPQLVSFEPRRAVRETAAARPQAAVVSVQFLPAAAALKKRWPFLPVIVTGDMKPKTAAAIARRGMLALPYPASNEMMLHTVAGAVFTSAARPEHWDRLKTKKSYALALSLPLLAAALLAGFFLRDARLPAAFPFPDTGIATPYAQPTNITFDGQYLWACDWYGQSIYQHATGRGLPLRRIFAFPGRHFSALAWVNGYIYSVDPWEKRIYKHALDEDLSILASYPAPGDAPGGLTGNGKVLWSCDPGTGLIYRHRLSDMAVEAAVPGPGGSPSGLYFDGTSLWSIDAKANRIYRHRTDDGLTVAAAFLPPFSEQKGYNLSGIAVDRGTLWICSEKAGKIFRCAGKSLKEVR